MIAVEGLRFGYRPDEPILQEFDHEFPHASVTAITGPSGGGKSTLLYLLGLLLTPQEGAVTFNGLPVSGGTDRQRARWRARTVGFVFQDAALDATRTVLDNVLEPALYADVPPVTARSRAQRLLKEFGVELRAHHKPGEVSGGQAQRVALCRALLAEPTVILADEPTGNLDSRTRDAVFGALRSIADNGATVIMATHDPYLARCCDEALHIDG